MRRKSIRLTRGGGGVRGVSLINRNVSGRTHMVNVIISELNENKLLLPSIKLLTLPLRLKIPALAFTALLSYPLQKRWTDLEIKFKSDVWGRSPEKHQKVKEVNEWESLPARLDPQKSAHPNDEPPSSENRSRGAISFSSLQQEQHPRGSI
ncbi:hypothetical protein CEXT_221461 [Caerostris extrusa]|uniref:Uncharacterized protein n=1 Tax=Caerostris extrusa TaxID=172846 RepID=A0AAV4PVF8_CAEEX|nr:hypothetical protein CEXT_221461 [Caerostris extrusa]